MNLSRNKLKKIKNRTFINDTKKAIQEIKKNKEKYLTPKEIYKTSKTIKKSKKSKKSKTSKIAKTPLNHNKEQLDEIKEINKECFKIMRQTNIKKLINEFKSKMIEKIHTTPIDGRKYKFFYKQNKGDNYKCYYAKVGCEEIEILNLEKISKNYEYFKVKKIAISYDEKHILFCVDVTGNRLCKLFLKPMFSKNHIEIMCEKNVDPLCNYKNNDKKHSTINNGNCVWDPNNIEFYYIIYNKILRPYQVYKYNIISKKHTFIYEEKNKFRFLSLKEVESEDFVLLYSSTYNGADIYIINQNNKNNVSKLSSYKKDFLLKISHKYNSWFVLETNKDSNVIYSTKDFKNKTILLKNTKSQIFKSIYFRDIYMLVFYKENGNNKILIYDTCNKKVLKKDLQICSTNAGCSYNIPEFSNLNEYVAFFFISVSSYLIPNQIFYVDLNKLTSVKINELTITNYNYKKYNEKLLCVTKDLHILMLYKKGTKLQNAKCLLYGYGSYGITINPSFNFRLISLLDRGFIYCIAYIRGGGRHGFNWYDQGRLLNKINTFDDFIKCGKYLISEKYTSSKRLAIWGRSAGGLLIGSTINMEPELCNLAILGVPFLDPVRILKEKNNHMSLASQIEWGDPNDEEYFNYMKQYSPQDNICLNSKYPNIFIYSNLHDTNVSFDEAYKYYNTIKNARVFLNKERDIHMMINMKYGHSQSSKRYEKNKEIAQIYDIIIKYIK